MAVPRLSRSARQEQILESVLDIVLERGVSVTSRELADAAGVAEGTLFKVFDTKENLLRALAAKEGGMADAVGEWLATVDAASMTLEDLVHGIIHSAIAQYRRSFELFYALGPYMDSPDRESIVQFERELQSWIEALRPHAAKLRTSPESAASILRMHAVAASDITAVWGQPISPAEHADIFLHGITTGPSTTGDDS